MLHREREKIYLLLKCRQPNEKVMPCISKLSGENIFINLTKYLQNLFM